MKKEIERRIIELGGSCNFKGESLKEDLLSISFQKSLLFNFSFEQIDKYEYLSSLRNNLHKVLAEKNFIPEADFPCTHFEFYILPYKNDDDFAEMSENPKVIMDGKDAELDASEFISIGHFEEFLMIMHMADENPDNPRIYCVDFQTPFDETLGEGESFMDFLNNLLTTDEYTSLLGEYMKKHKIGC